LFSKYQVKRPASTTTPSTMKSAGCSHMTAKMAGVACAKAETKNPSTTPTPTRKCGAQSVAAQVAFVKAKA
jgi:hypothetical protein